MSFVLPNSEPECTVELANGLSKEQLLSFPPFKEWISTLNRSLATQSSKDHTFHEDPYKLRKIYVQTVDFFGPRIGFLKLQTDVSNGKGEKLPGAVFMRGGSVGMLV
jgi:ADP-sugar diphosphatase